LSRSEIARDLRRVVSLSLCDCQLIPPAAICEVPKIMPPVLTAWRPLRCFAVDAGNAPSHDIIVSHAIVLLTLASWVGCFWLGFEIGKGRSEQQRKIDVDDLERRFRIVTGEVVAAPSGVPPEEVDSTDGDKPHRHAAFGA